MINIQIIKNIKMKSKIFNQIHIINQKDLTIITIKMITKTQISIKKICKSIKQRMLSFKIQIK